MLQSRLTTLVSVMTLITLLHKAPAKLAYVLFVQVVIQDAENAQVQASLTAKVAYQVSFYSTKFYQKDIKFIFIML